MHNILHNWRKTLNQGEKHLIMKTKTFLQAQELYKKIMYYEDKLKSAKDTINRLEARINKGDGTLNIEFSDMGLVEINVSDLIKQYKDKVEVIKALVETTKEQFNNI